MFGMILLGEYNRIKRYVMYMNDNSIILTFPVNSLSLRQVL